MMNECRIAEKLTELRLKKGVTQEDVAQSLSVSNRTVSKWENATSMPDLSMLVKLSEYYGVTTDALLGLAREESRDPQETVRIALEGLGCRAAIRKAFEVERAVIPVVFEKMARYEEESDSGEDAIPSGDVSAYRSLAASRDFYLFTANSEDVNLAVTLLRGKSDFAWLKDPAKQKRITEFFRFLAGEETLPVLYFLHTAECPRCFTADFVADKTGVPPERVSAVLKDFCAVGECSCMTAHLAEGDMDIYECCGDGGILAAIVFAYERMCGRRAYSYCWNGGCKMIGGKESESC